MASLNERLEMQLGEDRYYPCMPRFIEYKDQAQSRPAQDTELTFRNSTLMGNWLEERKSVQMLSKGEKLEGYNSHNYQTTYAKAFNCIPVTQLPKGLKNFVSYPSRRSFVAFPGHQPELNLRPLPVQEWISSYKRDFVAKPLQCDEKA